MYKGIREKMSNNCWGWVCYWLESTFSALQHLPTASKSDSRFESSFVWFQCGHHFLAPISSTKWTNVQWSGQHICAHPSPPNKQQLPPSPTSGMEVIHTCLFSSKCFKRCTNLGCLSAQCRIFLRQVIWENSLSINRVVVSGYKQLLKC